MISNKTYTTTTSYSQIEELFSDNIDDRDEPIFSNILEKILNKRWTSKGGYKNTEQNSLAMLREIKEELIRHAKFDEQKHQFVIHRNAHSEEQIQNKVTSIFYNYSTKNPELLWDLYSRLWYLEEAKALVALAKDIAGTEPSYYLQTLMPTIIIPEAVNSDCDLIKDFVLLIATTGNYLLAEVATITEVANRCITHGRPLLMANGLEREISNAKSVMKAVMRFLKTNKEEKHKEMSEKIQDIIETEGKDIDPIKTGLKVRTAQILYDLAVSGSSAEADRPDEPQDRDAGMDDKFASAIWQIGELDENDKEEYKRLVFCVIGGRTFQSYYKTVINGSGSCAGTFKRDLAKFLYENVDLCHEWKKNLKERYATATKGSDRSEHWIPSEDKIKIIINQNYSNISVNNIVCKNDLIQEKINQLKSSLPKIVEQLQFVKNKCDSIKFYHLPSCQFFQTGIEITNEAWQLKDTLSTCSKLLQQYFSLAAELWESVDGNPEIYNDIRSFIGGLASISDSPMIENIIKASMSFESLLEKKSEGAIDKALYDILINIKMLLTTLENYEVYMEKSQYCQFDGSF